MRVHGTDSELLRTLLLGFERAMLVSRCGDTLRARPVTLAHTRDTQRIWLLSGILGDGLEDIAADPNVTVVLQDGIRFCSVSGTARIARHARANPALSDSEGIGVRSGPSRQHLTLVQVTPQFAEYWDRAGLKGLKFESAEARQRREPVVPSVAPGAVLEGEWRTKRPTYHDNVIPLERARWKR
jgi:general stress protein 26